MESTSNWSHASRHGHRQTLASRGWLDTHPNLLRAKTPRRQSRMRLPVPVILKVGPHHTRTTGASPFTSQSVLRSTLTSRSAWRAERLRKRDLDD